MSAPEAFAAGAAFVLVVEFALLVVAVVREVIRRGKRG